MPVPPFFLMVPLLGSYSKAVTQRGWSGYCWFLAQTPPQCQSPIPTPAGSFSPLTPSPEPTCRGGYASSSTTQGSPQPVTDWSSFALTGDQLCDAAHALELPVGSGGSQVQQRPHLCSAPSPSATHPPPLAPVLRSALKKSQAPESHLRLCFGGNWSETQGKVLLMEKIHYSYRDNQT